MYRLRHGGGVRPPAPHRPDLRAHACPTPGAGYRRRSRFARETCRPRRHRGAFPHAETPKRTLAARSRSQTTWCASSCTGCAARKAAHEAPPRALWPFTRPTASRHVAALMRGAAIEEPQACPKGLRHAYGVAAGVPLSPRMRGNRQSRCPNEPARGSIPAHAGEPFFQYSLPRSVFTGLSPRMRGNLKVRDRREMYGLPRVYPRACGGTSSLRVPLSNPPGLSPRMRGNPLPPLLSGAGGWYSGPLLTRRSVPNQALRSRSGGFLESPGCITLFRCRESRHFEHSRNVETGAYGPDVRRAMHATRNAFGGPGTLRPADDHPLPFQGSRVKDRGAALGRYLQESTARMRLPSADLGFRISCIAGLSLLRSSPGALSTLPGIERRIPPVLLHWQPKSSAPAGIHRPGAWLSGGRVHGAGVLRGWPHKILYAP